MCLGHFFNNCATLLFEIICGENNQLMNKMQYHSDCVWAKKLDEMILILKRWWNDSASAYVYSQSCDRMNPLLWIVWEAHDHSLPDFISKQFMSHICPLNHNI